MLYAIFVCLSFFTASNFVKFSFYEIACKILLYCSTDYYTIKSCPIQDLLRNTKAADNVDVNTSNSNYGWVTAIKLLCFKRSVKGWSILSKVNLYAFDIVIIRIKEADRKKALCKKHSATDIWRVHQIQPWTYKSNRFLHWWRNTNKLRISVPPVCYYNTNQINCQEKYFES